MTLNFWFEGTKNVCTYAQISKLYLIRLVYTTFWSEKCRLRHVAWSRVIVILLFCISIQSLLKAVMNPLKYFMSFVLKTSFNNTLLVEETNTCNAFHTYAWNLFTWHYLVVYILELIKRFTYEIIRKGIIILL